MLFILAVREYCRIFQIRTRNGSMVLVLLTLAFPSFYLVTKFTPANVRSGIVTAYRVFIAIGSLIFTLVDICSQS